MVGRPITFFFPSTDTSSESKSDFKVTGCSGMQNVMLNNKIYFFESKNEYEIKGNELIIDGIKASDYDLRIIRILDRNGKDFKPKYPTGFLSPSEASDLIFKNIEAYSGTVNKPMR